MLPMVANLKNTPEAQIKLRKAVNRSSFHNISLITCAETILMNYLETKIHVYMLLICNFVDTVVDFGMNMWSAQFFKSIKT